MDRAPDGHGPPPNVIARPESHVRLRVLPRTALSGVACRRWCPLRAWFEPCRHTILLWSRDCTDRHAIVQIPFGGVRQLATRKSTGEWQRLPARASGLCVDRPGQMELRPNALG